MVNIKFGFGKPKPRQIWSDDDRKDIIQLDHHHESWLDLFLDLAFVAEFSNLSHIFLACGINFKTMVFVFSLFLIFFNSRLCLDGRQ